jgi:hypothetical protein
MLTTMPGSWGWLGAMISADARTRCDADDRRLRSRRRRPQYTRDPQPLPVHRTEAIQPNRTAQVLTDVGLLNVGVHGGDTRATGDHEEVGREVLLVDELALGATDLDRVALLEPSKVLGYVALGVGLEV